MNRDVALMREVVVKLTQLLAGKGFRVTQEGLRAFVETDASGRPTRVNIPNIPDNASESLIMAIQGFIDHEVGHILDTDFSVQLQAKKKGERFYSLWNVIEDPYVENTQRARFPGAAYNLNRLHQFFLDEITTPALKEATDPQDRFGILMVPIARAWAGQQVFQDFMKPYWDEPGVKELIDKIRPAQEMFAGMTSSRDTFDVASEVLRLLDLPPEEEKSGPGPRKRTKKNEKSDSSAKADKNGKAPKSDEKNEDEDSSEKDDASGDPSDEENDDKDGDEDGDADGDDSEGDDSEGGDDEGDGDEGTAADEDGKPSKDKIKPNEELNDERGSKFEFPLKNTSFDDSLSSFISAKSLEAAKAAPYVVYTTDQDVIEKFNYKDRLHTDFRDNWVSDMDDKTRAMVGVMQKDIERMMAARSKVFNTPGFRSGKLNASGLHRLATNDDRVFRRREEHKSKDVAVCLLIDNSGSMGGSRMTTAMHSAYALSQTLERVGIKHEVLGFTTCGSISGTDLRDTSLKLDRGFSRTERLYMPIYKEYVERITPEIRKRFAASFRASFLANNVDGECVDIAMKRLEKRTEARRVLIVLSDGQPCANSPSGGLQRHLKEVVKSAPSRRIECVGIGIETDAVAAYYPKHLVLHNLDSLPKTVMNELKAILTA